MLPLVPMSQPDDRIEDSVIRRLLTWLVPVLIVLPLSSCKIYHDKLDAYLTAANEQWGFTGSVLVAWKGKVILSKGYGMANQHLGIPNTPETKFFIGSITKQFTAAAILKLAEEGQLSVDDPIGEHLPTYPAPDADRIAIHHLLTHTSGIPNYTEIPEVLLRRTTHLTPTDLMSTFAGRPLKFQPGTDFEYSNSGYVVLGAIIEAVSGQSYEAYLHANIFRPVGMHNSGYARREMAMPKQAVGYTQTEDGILINAPLIHLSVMHTAGALYSTVEDMLLWDQALYDGTVISRHSVQRMLTPGQNGYGYGWVIEGLYGHRHTFHGGYLDGFNTTFDRWVDDKVSIIVFANDDVAPVKKIARGLAAILLGRAHPWPIERQPTALDPAVLGEYHGVYLDRDGQPGYVTVVNDTLRFQMEGQPRQILLPEDKDRFFMALDNTVAVEFERDDTGRVEMIVITDEGRSRKLERLASKEESGQLAEKAERLVDIGQFNDYTGVYLLESLINDSDSGFFLVVSRWEDRLYAAAQGTDVIELEPRSDSQFVYGLGGFELTFRRDDEQVTGCILRMNNAEIVGTKIR